MSRADDPSGEPAGAPPSERADPPRRGARSAGGGSGANWSRGADAIGAALTFAVAVGGFTLGGWWLDGKLGVSPLLLILGAALGLLGGFLYVVKTLAPEALPWTAPRDRGAGGADGAAARDATPRGADEPRDPDAARGDDPA